MSDLRQSLAGYLGMRRACGFELRETGRTLEKLVSFAEQQGASFLTVRLALEWARQPTDAQPALWAKRLSMARCFARYLRALDPRTEIPAKGLLPHQYRRKTPYLYSDSEIDQLLKAAQKLPSATGLRAATYTTFLGLLAVTGMRMGEAVHLDCDDVDLAQGLLTLRRTKSGKARYVPIHLSTRQALLDYQAHRDRIYPKPQTASFFLSEQGRRLREGMVRETFVKLSCQVGLRHPSQSQGPRLHDLRHRFAVSTLVSWYRSGLDVEAQLPKLTTYLGHTHVNDTYWYLTAVPELLEWATFRLEQDLPTEPKR